MVPICNRSQCSDSLRAWWSGDQIPVEARFSTPVQTGPGAHPAPYTMGTRSFLEVKWPGLGVDHPPHLASRLKSRAIHLLPLWAFVACSRVNFTFTFTLMQQHKDLNSYFPIQKCRASRWVCVKWVKGPLKSFSCCAQYVCLPPPPPTISSYPYVYETRTLFLLPDSSIDNCLGHLAGWASPNKVHLSLWYGTYG